LGDLGNLTAGADGTVNFNFHVKGLELSGDKGVVGRSVIVHAAPDDLATQPSGNSGKRLACGTIAHL
jgi:Cu-Zn family superoxide dismutase